MSETQRLNDCIATDIDGVTCEVHSSNGDFIIKSSGHIISFTPDQEIDNNTLEHMQQIKRFNVVEYLQVYGGTLPTDFDILDLGYWYAKPGEDDNLCQKYEPPAYDWRRDIVQAYKPKEG